MYLLVYCIFLVGKYCTVHLYGIYCDGNYTCSMQDCIAEDVFYVLYATIIFLLKNQINK